MQSKINISQFDGPDRASIKGEYKASAEYAKDKGIPFLIDLASFEAVCCQPCTFCGGYTPKYEGNAVTLESRKVGFVTDNLKPMCWPCKNILGNYPRARLEQVCTIAKHVNGTSGASGSLVAGAPLSLVPNEIA